jgi:hypothetical protein
MVGMALVISGLALFILTSQRSNSALAAAVAAGAATDTA